MIQPGNRKRAGAAAKSPASRWLLVTLAVVLVVAAGVYALVSRGGGSNETAAPPPPPTIPGESTPPASCAPTDKLVPPCGAWWGMHVPVSSDAELVSGVEGIEKQIGRKLDVTISYHDMSDSEAGRFFREGEVALSSDRITFLGWESSIWSDNLDIPWREIAAGYYDQAITDQAARVKEYGKPVLVGFDGEKDRDETGQDPKDYIAAYKRIVDGFRREGATNAVWVWGVTGYYPFRDRWKAYYPGDEYVDWISYDPYNFASCRNASWQNFEETVRPTYDWFQENGFAGKPMMLAEYGTESDKGDSSARADWYRDIPNVAKTMPNLKAFIQWNNVDGDSCDFRLTGSGVMEAFAEAGRDPYFKQPGAAQGDAAQATG
ncbi:glycoside hydrolase family 26 protein [Streptosporangium sandarakinum]|uniref:GH26 domain-containing protein n=1 Tax=Streptosporangium sandarakinum TaxID=1260955 RepID=A0A852UX77_9ACTN|nr:glycosyl hydrolase [Streptosporangium sandarakinum]NYF42012.1 hypothetical protein [Streptosporangium sandarakinum]